MADRPAGEAPPRRVPHLRLVGEEPVAFDDGDASFTNDAALVAEDEASRARALDVRSSFLVQAPAGSGKTELLIQRYLALLGTVDDPARIVALTFTKKAAGEMRERVLRALAFASQNDVPPEAAHQRRTWELAREAVEQDRRRGWSLAAHPSRLRIQTFDALATSLARRAPLASALGPHPGYVDDARSLYLRAAEECVLAASANDANWRTLLLHFRNDAERVVQQLAGMLEKRDQWLRQVTGETNAALRSGLEAALRAEIVEVLGQTRRAFPEGTSAQIVACATNAAETFRQAGREDFADALEACAAAGGLPPATVEALPHWRTLAAFLLTRDGANFRRRITKAEGFESEGKGAGAAERRERKAAMESLCRALNEVPGLAAALSTAAGMPEPAIGDEAWRIVEALVDVLRHAAAKLTTVFAALREVDFVQANLAALNALGDGDAPSELLLQLDANVHHLLIDEFQDTSYVQLALLERLTAGWVPGDGRTLFAVGDPMQSIYRFREAEVRFFLEAQATGRIADIPVDSLHLRRNFRSQANLVRWCNRTFAQVLGRVGDPARAIVPFEAAVAARPARDGIDATFECFEDANREAARVVALIREAQQAGANDIAVLVRARGHLASLLPVLRREKIAFAAIELDLLSQRQSVLDLAALAHALIQPCDRLAWLAVLRAPWCGLKLADLLAVGSALGPSRTAAWPRVLDDLDAIVGLSEDGRARLRRTVDVLRAALAARGDAGVAQRVRGTWLALGGPACLDDALDLDAAALFFELVAAHERGGDLPDWDGFLAALGALHASPAVATDGGVQIMTMHKAKGLEFDTVILPGLANEGRRPDPPLLRWRRRDAGLLIAPAPPRGADEDPLYRYLGRLDVDEEDAELGRLLYVACTRAKTRLHLLAAPGTRTDPKTGALAWKDAASGSSLHKLGPAFSDELPLVARDEAPPSVEVPPPPLRRLARDARLAQPVPPIPAPSTGAQGDEVTPAFDWARETTRRIGTLAHRLLARIAGDGLGAWPAQRIDAMAPRVRAELAGAGLSPAELPEAVERVLHAIRRTLSDARGRWLFDPRHADARSEWALSGVDEGAIVHIVVDRTFVADGVRWIVDFKTGAHEGGDAAAFLDREVERYRGQLLRYGRMLQRLDPRPVRLALYYPLVDGGFREVEAIPARTASPGPARQLALFDGTE